MFNPQGVKPLICLKLQFSHLNKHKFKHNFGDTLILYVLAEQMLILLGTYSWVVIFIPLKYQNSLISLKSCRNFFNLNGKDKCLFSLYGSQINNPTTFSQNNITIAINYLKTSRRLDRSIISFSQ